jgi:hypothetical protein
LAQARNGRPSLPAPPFGTDTIEVDRTGAAPSSSNPDLRLYDSAIQTLVGAGLKLEYCAETLGPASGEAKSIDEVLDRLGDLIDEIRGRMYQLSSEVEG